ncbi:MAG TPA: twin-arginine translocation signal domain-containing protein, partial [Sphingopyxis sp.]|nr:twin-arginine translocation signal domain-containing protein [Sphingopyxis sp.]
MIDRRRFMGAAAATGLSGFVPSALNAQEGAADRALEALLQRHSEAYLRRSPEEATANNFDTGAHAVLRSRLDDRSLAARA